MFETLCDELANEFCIPRYIMRKILLSFKKKLIEAVENGEDFVLSGLLSVKHVTTKEYKRINPFTGKEIHIKARRQTKITPSKKIKFSPLKKEKK